MGSSKEDNYRKWIETILVVFGVVVGFYGIYASRELVSLSNSISQKIRDEVKTQLYLDNYLSAAQTVLAFQFIRTTTNYDAEIWSLNALLEYFSRTDLKAAQDILPKIRMNCEINGHRKYRTTLEFLLEKTDYLSECLSNSGEKNSIDSDSRLKMKNGIKGALWCLHHIRIIQQSESAGIDKRVADSTLKHKILKEIISSDAELSKQF